jgi:thiol:disulfide interchange protein DsbD
MRRAAPVFFLGLSFFLLRVSCPAAGAPSPGELLAVSAQLRAAGGSGAGTLAIEARVAPGWHVNSHKPSEDYLIPTQVRIDPNPAVVVGEPRYPEGKSIKFAFAEKPLSVYEDRFTIEVPVTFHGAAPGSLKGAIEFQACNDKQCLAPASVVFEATGAPAVSGGSAAALTGGAVALSQAPESPRDAAPQTESNDFGKLIERRGLFLALLAVFGWGLALNLTPCVYPVIPLTVSYFGGQAQGRSRRVFGLAALYVLGMATMYSALGVVAALSGRLFGVALQSPWVLAGVAAVLVALALSMFGLYEIRVPTGLMQKAGARAGGAGAYAMGLLVGVVAAPCIGPVVLALLTFVASRQDAAFGFLIFFVLSLGLGLPYLFLAVFSGSLARLPRAGEWMEGIKRIFGWILLAMAAYFLKTALPAPLGTWLLPAVLLMGAVALAVASRSLQPALRVGAAILFLGAAFFFVPHQVPASEGPSWLPYSESAVRGAGRPAVIDFAASWCAPCLELDHKTFVDPRVREELSRRALFKADLTRAASSESIALTEKYQILGVPTVIFLDAAGVERKDLRLVGFEGPKEFLARLAKAP